MSDARNFLDYYESLHAAIRWATGNVGSRLNGLLATMGNVLAQGMRFVLINRLPGEPECAPDARDQIGSDRDLFRFRTETDLHWTERIKGAWDQYEQGGTPQGVLADVQQWGESAYPTLWPGPVPTIQEGGWARFTLTLPYGSTPWTTGEVYDSGVTYDSGAVYDVGNANGEDLDHLRRIVRKWKPARSRATIHAIISPDVFFYDDGTTYDSGAIYAGPGDALVIGV